MSRPAYVRSWGEFERAMSGARFEECQLILQSMYRTAVVRRFVRRLKGEEGRFEDYVIRHVLDTARRHTWQIETQS